MRRPSPDLLKRADRWAWRPAGAAGAAIGRAAGLARRHPPDGRPLIVRPGGMGDLICAQIAMEELGADPGEALWLVERRSAAWAAHASLPHVVYDDDPRRLAPLLGRHGLVMNTEQLFGLSMAPARAALAPGGRLVAFATNRAARGATSLVPYDAYVSHETAQFRRLLGDALGLPAAEGARVRERSRPAGGELLVCVAGRQSPSRDLPVERWAELVEPWAGGEPVTITAAPVDRAFGEALAAALPAARTVDAGLGELCGRVATASQMLTVDGGMAHVASYYGVPATVVFTSGRDLKWAPLGAGSRTIMRDDLVCRPCTVFGQTPPCPYGFACKQLSHAAHRNAVEAGL